MSSSTICPDTDKDIDEHPAKLGLRSLLPDMCGKVPAIQPHLEKPDSQLLTGWSCLVAFAKLTTQLETEHGQVRSNVVLW